MPSQNELCLATGKYWENCGRKLDAYVIERWRRVFPHSDNPYVSDLAVAERFSHMTWFWNLSIQLAISKSEDWFEDVTKAMFIHGSQEGLYSAREFLESLPSSPEKILINNYLSGLDNKFNNNLRAYSEFLQPLADSQLNSIFAQEYLDTLTLLDSPQLKSWLDKNLNATYKHTFARWRRLYEEFSLIEKDSYMNGIRRILSVIDSSERELIAQLWNEQRAIDPKDFRGQIQEINAQNSWSQSYSTNFAKSYSVYLKSAVESPTDSVEVQESMKYAKWAISSTADSLIENLKHEKNNALVGPPCRLVQLRLLHDAFQHNNGPRDSYYRSLEQRLDGWCPLHQSAPKYAIEFLERLTVWGDRKLVFTRLGTQRFAELARNSRPFGLSPSGLRFLTHDNKQPLLPWQVSALHSWAAHGRVGVITAATGTGKSRLGVAAILEGYEHDFATVFLTHRLVIKGQWRKDELFAMDETDIQNYRPNEKDRVFQKDRNVFELSSEDSYDYFEPPRISSKQVLLALDKSLSTRPHLSPVKLHDSLLVADEVHQFSGEQGQKVLEQSFDRKMGLSATVGYEDSLVMQHFDSGLVADYPIHRAIRDKVISEYNLLVIRVELLRVKYAFGEYHELDLSKKVETHYSAEDLEAAKVRLEECRLPLINSQDGIKLEEGEDFEPAVERIIRNRDPKHSKPARAYLRAKRDYDRISRGSKFSESVLQLLAPKINEYGQTLVFANLRNNGREFERELLENRVDVTYIDGDTEQYGRQDAFRALQEGRTKAIIAPQILDEGVNIPNARIGIFLGPGNKGYRQVVQRMGRVLRKKPNASGRALLILAVGIGTREDPGLEGRTSWYGDSTFDIMTRHKTDQRIVDYSDPDAIRDALDDLLEME
jgi:superfamily II DNA or RNA helicase